MAQQEAKPAEGEKPPAPKKKKLLIIIIAAVLVLVLGAGAALFLMKSKQNAEDLEEEEEVTETTKKKDQKKSEHPPVFVNLDPFTVNLVQENGEQYLQVALSVEFDNPEAEALMKANMPKVRDAIIRHLASKKASELANTEGKNTLAEELKTAINAILQPPAPKKKKGEKGKQAENEGPAHAVLFTAFIIQ